MELARLVHRHHLPARQEDHLDDAPDVVPHCLELQVGLEGLDLDWGWREGGREDGLAVRERHPAIHRHGGGRVCQQPTRRGIETFYAEVPQATRCDSAQATP